MAASIASVVTLGFGTGSFAGESGLVVTLGFGTGVGALVDRWANVTRLNLDPMGRLAVSADGIRSEVKCDEGRT